MVGFEQQVGPNGHARVLYEPRRDPVIQQHALELGAHCARVVLQGVDAVSPNQRDPDGHRLLVATELTRTMLAEVYRMVGAVAGWALEQHLGASGAEPYGRAAAAAQGVVPPAPRPVYAQPRSGGGQKRAAQRAQRVPRAVVANRRG